MKCLLCVFGIMIAILGMGQKRKFYAKVAVSTDFVKPKDSIGIVIFRYGQGQLNAFRETRSLITQDGRLEFSIAFGERVQYVDVEFYLPHVHLGFLRFRPLHVWNRDSVNLDVHDGELSFTGSNPNFYKLQKQLYYKDNTPSMAFNYDDPVSQLESFDSAYSVLTRLIESYKGSVEKTQLQTLLAMETLSSESLKKYYVKDAIHKAEIKGESGNKYLEAWRAYWEKNSVIKQKLRTLESNGTLQLSSYYPEYVLQRYQFDSCLIPGKPLMYRQRFNYIVDNYKGLVREKILTRLISTKDTSLPFVLSNSNPYIFINKDFRGYYESQRAKFSVGTQAQDFALLDLSGKKVKLSDFKGKVVLLDFWYTGCGNCRMAHPFLDRIKGLLTGEPFELISVSIDENKTMWKKSVESGAYTSSLNINLYTNGLGDKHPFIKYYNIIGYPTFMLIDKKGRLKSPPKDPRQDNGEAMLLAIKSAISEK